VKCLGGCNCCQKFYNQKDKHLWEASWASELELKWRWWVQWVLQAQYEYLWVLVSNLISHFSQTSCPEHDKMRVLVLPIYYTNLLSSLACQYQLFWESMSAWWLSQPLGNNILLVWSGLIQFTL
jgi:hypothetical protein